MKSKRKHKEFVIEDLSIISERIEMEIPLEKLLVSEKKKEKIEVK